MEITNQVVLAVPVILSPIEITGIFLLYDICGYLEILFLLIYHLKIMVVIRPATRSYYLIDLIQSTYIAMLHFKKYLENCILM